MSGVIQEQEVGLDIISLAPIEPFTCQNTMKNVANQRGKEEIIIREWEQTTHLIRKFECWVGFLRHVQYFTVFADFNGPSYAVLFITV